MRWIVKLYHDNGVVKFPMELDDQERSLIGDLAAKINGHESLGDPYMEIVAPDER